METPQVGCQSTWHRLEMSHSSLAIASLHDSCSVACLQLEDDLLYKLSSAEGDMTEDVALIESLEESKRVADEISLKVAEAKTTEEQINEARDKVPCLHALHRVSVHRHLERSSLWFGACVTGTFPAQQKPGVSLVLSGKGGWSSILAQGQLACCQQVHRACMRPKVWHDSFTASGYALGPSLSRMCDQVGLTAGPCQWLP